MGAPKAKARERVSSEVIAQLRRAIATAGDLLDEERPPLRFTAKLCEQFLRWSRKRNSRKWVRAQERILTWWREELERGRTAEASSRSYRLDVAELELVRDILPALERAPGARAHRIAVLKKFCAWLRFERHLLAAADDPTAELHVPQNTPAQWTRSKVIPRAAIEATREQLRGRWRDALDVLLGTAWHVTELERFARAGEILPAPPAQLERGAAGVLATRHKSRAPHLTAVSARVLEAARRLTTPRGRKGLSASRFNKKVRAAAAAAGVAPWTPGALRHTVSSFALEAGADDAAVSSFLGHADKRTTRRWYTLWVAPLKIPTLA